MGHFTVLSDPANFVKLHLRWCLFSGVVLAFAGIWYWVVTRDGARWPGGGSVPGLVFGVLAGAIIIFECAIGLRKTKWFRTQRLLGSAQGWMKAHIWLGLLVLPMAWLHSGFAFGGTFTTVLMWLMIVVVASGIWGLAMQNILPRWMTEDLRSETVFSQIDLVRRQYAAEAERIVFVSCGSDDPIPYEPGDSAGSEVEDPGVPQTRVVGSPRRVGTIIKRNPVLIEEEERLPGPTKKNVLQAYERTVRPYLERPAGGFLASRRKSHDFFEALRASAGEGALPTVNALEQLCDRTRDLHRQRIFHYLLHSWLVIHLPISLALLILLVLHIYHALRFG